MPAVTIDLKQDFHAKLCELAAQQRVTPEEMLTRIVASPIGRLHFARFAAPQDYFDEKRAVTDDEVSSALRFVEDRIGKEHPGHRRESVMYGLMLAAIELGFAVCDDAGHEGLDDGYFFAEEIFTDLLSRMHKVRKLGFA